MKYLNIMLIALICSGCNAKMGQANPTKPIFDNTSKIDIILPADSGIAENYDFNTSDMFIDIPNAAQYVVIAFFNSQTFYNSSTKTIDWTKCIAGIRTNLIGYQNEQSIAPATFKMQKFIQGTGDFTGGDHTFTTGTYYWAAWGIKDGTIAWSTPPWINHQP